MDTESASPVSNGRAVARHLGGGGGRITRAYVPRTSNVLIVSSDGSRPVGLARALESSTLARFEATLEPRLDVVVEAIKASGADVVVVDASLEHHDPSAIADDVREAAPHLPVAWLVDAEEIGELEPLPLTGLDDIIVWPDEGAVPADHALLQAVQRHRMLARLQERRVEIRTLVQGITHDLRGPLASLDYLLEMAQTTVQEQNPAPEHIQELREHLERSRSTVDAMSSLVEEILRVAEITSRRARDQPHALRPLMDLVATELASLAEQRKVTVELRIDDVVVLGDRTRLFHLAYNLLHNAIKHTARGSTVQLSARTLDGAADSGIRIQVEDEGQGIPDDVPPQATVQEYLNMHPPIPGHGMGLQVATMAAAHHNAKVRVMQRPAGGSTFFLDLPAARVLQPS